MTWLNMKVATLADLNSIVKGLDVSLSRPHVPLIFRVSGSEASMRPMYPAMSGELVRHLQEMGAAFSQTPLPAVVVFFKEYETTA